MTRDSSIVLSVHQLKKRIKDRLIIKGISFQVKRGEIFGFLGPNGSGKTTTIRMLVGLIKPTEGTIELGGYDIRKQPTEALRQVGCIVENPELYPYMTGLENLEHFARMLPGVGAERIREVTDIVGLGQRIGDKVKTYSLGMRQRLGIAQALLGSPSLLILDEPTNGLDPQGIKEMRDFIKRLASEGLSLFVSSHLLSEIQQMCDRVAIISHGSVIAVGEVDELLRQAGSTVVWHAEPVERAKALLAETEGVQLLETAALGLAGDETNASAPGRAVTVQMDEARIPELNERMVAERIRVYAIQITNPTLEELFLRVTEGEKIE
ncbi:ABC transporter ATP-binding protein [Paenibacillus flagellatus]|uniref:ABC transporter ATP-binding protein n=1 Tax=Paenibacillus flagellatus TaxID=2211139 RepID=A0A2V5K7N8_9BACL|nr:ABC transporter ATP-binding protein [Paenibacillus flagellatus]PYI54832.1 ABC transporter ATP-binding protein [Paenibacillus flagellatus]